METTQCANKNKAGNYRAKVVKKVGQEGQDYILEEGRHYLFRDANSFPRAKLMENCELWAVKDIFLVLVLSGQYLFVEAHSFPRALLQETHIFRAKWRLLSLLDNLEFMHHVSLRALRTPIGLVYSYDAYKFPLSETTHFSFVFSLYSFRTMYFPFSRQCHSKSSTPVKWSCSNFLNNLISQIFQDVLNPSSS